MSGTEPPATESDVTPKEQNEQSEQSTATDNNLLQPEPVSGETGLEELVADAYANVPLTVDNRIVFVPEKHNTSIPAFLQQQPDKEKSKKKKKKGKKPKSSVADETEAEEEEDWSACVCGYRHPPVATFTNTPGKCTFYRQMAELMPYITVSRLLETETAFLAADSDGSGFIDKNELAHVLMCAIGPQLPNYVVEKTFRGMDRDDNGYLDFLEIASVVDNMIQRKGNNLPYVVNAGFSKICAIQ